MKKIPKAPLFSAGIKFLDILARLVKYLAQLGKLGVRPYIGKFLMDASLICMDASLAMLIGMDASRPMLIIMDASRYNSKEIS